MTIYSHGFMKMLGASAASLFLTRSRSTQSHKDERPVKQASSARERLRLYWLRIEELARRSEEHMDSQFGNALLARHRFTLAELVASKDISSPVADFIQMAYEAAVDHIRPSNLSIMCYRVVDSNAPISVEVLVEQSQVLNQIAEEGTIDPDTLSKAQSALEHDLAFYALTDNEIQTLYDELSQRKRDPSQPLPSFEALTLELTPEQRTATRFIIDLLTGK